MILIISSLIFIIGLCIGSFLNVISDRLPQNKSFLVGRSYCDSCKRTLRPIDLVPVISYFFLKGKCRYCGAKLSRIYPISELLTGCLFLSMFLFTFGLSPQVALLNSFFTIQFLYYLVIISLLIIVYLTDSKYSIIPNKIILVGVIISSIFIILFFPQLFILHFLSGVGASLFFLSLTLLTRGKGMGMGDVKFVFFMGLFLGFPGILIGIYLAFLTGALIAIILILCHKKKFHGSTIPFGPFLVFGTILALIFQHWIISQGLPLFFR